MNVKDAADHAARERPGHPADLVGGLVEAERAPAEFAWRMFDHKAVKRWEHGTEERAVSKADGRECPNVAEQDLGERSDSAGEQADQQHLWNPILSARRPQRAANRMLAIPTMENTKPAIIEVCDEEPPI